MLPPVPPAIATTAAYSLAEMQGHRRVLILTAPTTTDPLLVQQRHELAGWRKQREDRDVTIVEIVGAAVSGATDTAPTLRHQWRLPANGFHAVLIGKDGHEAFRTDRPFDSAGLTRTIDAMPMRRAGQR